MTHADAYKRFDGQVIGSRIKALRKARGLSLQELGDSSGFSKSHVWEMESGKVSNPSAAMIVSFAASLNTDIDHLLYGSLGSGRDAFVAKFERLIDSDRRKVLGIIDIFLEGKMQ